MLPLLFTLVLGSFIHAAEAPPTPAEKRYLADRDAAIAQVTAHPQLDVAARGKLEKQMRQIVGDPGVVGFKEPGSLSLETLQKGEPGFGQFDGLLFSNASERLFVTTLQMYKQYFKETDLDQLARSDEFYPKVFGWDVAITVLADVPLERMLGRASLVFEGQDIGAYPPKNIIVFTVSSRHILILEAPLNEDLQIPKCQSLWRKITGKKPTPEQEDKAFAAYRTCWKENAASQPFFPAIKARVNALAKRVDLP